MKPLVKMFIATGKPWKIIIGFALLGLATAGAAYAYAASYNYGKTMTRFDLALETVSVILCPTQLYFAFCIDCEVIGRDGFILYSIIGVSNALLYAGIGAVIAGLRKKSDEPP